MGSWCHWNWLEECDLKIEKLKLKWTDLNSSNSTSSRSHVGIILKFRLFLTAEQDTFLLWWRCSSHLARRAHFFMSPCGLYRLENAQICPLDFNGKFLDCALWSSIFLCTFYYKLKPWWDPTHAVGSPSSYVLAASHHSIKTPHERTPSAKWFIHRRRGKVRYFMFQFLVWRFRWTTRNVSGQIWLEGFVCVVDRLACKFCGFAGLEGGVSFAEGAEISSFRMGLSL
jgi:hypothetical protein